MTGKNTKQKGFISIKAKILVPMIVIIFIAILTVTLLMNYQNRKLVSSNANDILTSNLKTVQIITKDWNANAMSTITATAEIPELKEAVKNNDLQTIEKLLSNIYETGLKISDKSLFANVCFLDLEGNVLMTGKNREGVGLNIYKDTPYGENIDKAKQKEIFRSVVLPSPVNGKMEMWYSAPIIDNDQVIGIIALPTFIELIEYYVNDSISSDLEKMNTFLADQDGTIVATTNQEILGKKLADVGYNFKPEQKDQMIETKNSNNKNILLMYNNLELMNWTAYTEMDNVLIMRGQYITTFLVSLFVVIAASIILYFIISKVTKNIGLLNQVAKNIGNGITNANISVHSNDELGELANSFREVQKSISLLIAGFNRISNSVINGNLTDRGDINLVSGDFSEIIENVNSIIDNMTGYLDNLTLPIIITDKNAQITFVNKSGLTSIDSNLPDIIGKDFVEVFADNNNEEKRIAFKKIIETGSIFNMQVSATDNAGEQVFMDYTCLPNKNSNGDIVGFMSFFNDITPVVTTQKASEKIAEYQVHEVNQIIKELDKLANGKLDFVYQPKVVDKDTESAYNNFKQISNSLAQSTQTIKSYMDEMTVKLGDIAGKNFDVEITRSYIGDFVSIKDSIELITENMNSMLNEIQVSSKQVEYGAAQVSESNQNLMNDLNTQVTRVSDVKAAIARLSEETHKNAENAENANRLSDNAKNSAENGNIQMQSLAVAMDEIKQASNDIAKVIKIIEDIAFQTNLLALNAAVEAARAGQHGKGFAVVAEEVRSLAGRSQVAAKETTSMIETSLNRVNAGSQIALQTSYALNEIVSVITETVGVVREITQASNNQADEITKIQENIEEIYTITENNTNFVQNNVSISEELASQANMLESLTQQFKLKHK